MKALAARLEHSAVGFVGKGNGQRSTFDARGDGGTRERMAMSGGAPGGIFPAMVVPSQRAVVRWRQCGNAACTAGYKMARLTEFPKVD